MNEVSSWLAQLGGAQNYWVGAQDWGGTNDVIWMENAMNLLDSSWEDFWIPGEPNHEGGDCVYLKINNGLGMNHCDTTIHPLCRLYE